MRYFFNLIDGDTCTDLGGSEFASEEAARQEAILRSVDGSYAYSVRGYQDFRYIRLRDETGRIVCKLPIEHNGTDGTQPPSQRSADD